MYGNKIHSKIAQGMAFQSNMWGNKREQRDGGGGGNSSQVHSLILVDSHQSNTN